LDRPEELDLSPQGLDRLRVGGAYLRSDLALALNCRTLYGGSSCRWLDFWDLESLRLPVHVAPDGHFHGGTTALAVILVAFRSTTPHQMTSELGPVMSISALTVDERRSHVKRDEYSRVNRR
jgi:hypothetical protein